MSKSLATRRTLRLLITAGVSTCYRAKDEPCELVRTRHFGFAWHCGTFNQELSENADGWLARLPDCIASDASS